MFHSLKLHKHVKLEKIKKKLHATYIEHNLYADFSFKLEKLLRENFLRQIHSSR